MGVCSGNRRSPPPLWVVTSEAAPHPTARNRIIVARNAETDPERGQSRSALGREGDKVASIANNKQRDFGEPWGRTLCSGVAVDHRPCNPHGPWGEKVIAGVCG